MFLSHSQQFSNNPKRIVSVVPSQTELLFELGLNEEVIGITKFCIHPEEYFKVKPRIGGTKQLNIEKICALHPDLVIANKEENVKEQIETLALNFPVFVTDVNTLEDALQMIITIGNLVNKTTESIELFQKIKHSFESLPVFTGIKTAYLIWKDPWMVAAKDTFIDAMMHCAGFHNAFSDYSRYPAINISEVETREVELLLLSSEPYPFTQKHLYALQQMFPKAKVMLVNGELFSWYGSRMQYAPAYFRQLQARLSIDICG